MRHFLSFAFLLAFAFCLSAQPGPPEWDSADEPTETVAPDANVPTADVPTTDNVNAAPADTPESVEQEVDPVVDETDPPADIKRTLWEFIKANWAGLIAGLLLFIEGIVRATPTTKDDAWFHWLKKILDGILPSRKAGGGTFNS
jgi:hypothetical protein